jgi:hypothetical protein
MTTPDKLASFISSSFRSIWALELLLVLKREGRPCSTDELVATMRASGAVVDRALDSLVAAGLADVDGPHVRYAPAGPDTAALVDGTEQLYRSRPDRVRRLIIASSHRGLAAFSDAFRLGD